MSKLYPLATSSWNHEEIEALQEVIRSQQFTMGARVKRFEKEFAEYIGTKHAVMVNSGSSANLLMIAALIYSGKLKPGDSVAVPRISWSTTFTPLQQFGLNVIFYDVGPDFNIDSDLISRVFYLQNIKPKVIFAVNLLGQACDFVKLQRIADEMGSIIIEDNCESLGAMAETATSGTKKTGSIGLMGSHSFFFSHHINTMEGGMITTDSDELQQYLVSLRAHGWTRELPNRNLFLDKKGDEFKDKFEFVLPGYNVRPSEMAAAVGSVQLKKLPEMIALRHYNLSILLSEMNLMKNKNLVMQDHHGYNSSFAFAFIHPKRNEILPKLDRAFIEYRPIVAGDYTNQKALKYYNYTIHSNEEKMSSKIDRYGFMIGNNPVKMRNAIGKFIEIVDKV